MSSDYEQYQQELAPVWLRGPHGTAWLIAFGEQKDALVERLREAIKAGFVLLAPADALPLLGADAAIERVPGETDASYRARVHGAWDTHSHSGTPQGIVNALVAHGYTGAVVREKQHWPELNWYEFSVVLYPPNGFFWDDNWAGLGTWGETAYAWDSTVTTAQLAAMAAIIRGKSAKAAHAKLKQIVIVTSSTPWGDSDATWGTFNGGWNDSVVATYDV